MASMSDYLENELIKHLFRTGSFTKPTVMAVALFTVAPTDAGSGTEVTGGAYARVDVPPLDANWNATSGTDGATANTSAVTFPAPVGANWGTVVAFALFDATTAGNMIAHASLDASKIINDGDAAPVFNAGDLTFTFA